MKPRSNFAEESKWIKGRKNERNKQGMNNKCKENEGRMEGNEMNRKTEKWKSKEDRMKIENKACKYKVESRKEGRTEQKN